uniref:Rhodanese-like domain-containing protein n=1 Tax=Desulfobacca acetoxidans TaxID=60893 RepID=A0A7V4G9H6_9BACT
MGDRQRSIPRWPGREDLLWAGFLLLMSVVFGLFYHWPLVKIAWQGELYTHMDKLRAERRAQEFKGIKTMSLEETHRLWKEGQTLFVDARPAEEYAELHIKGAMNVPWENLERLKDTGILGIPRDRRILVYCSDTRCDLALKLARHLQSLGFTQVVAFLGGFSAWDEAGYEVDTSR